MSTTTPTTETVYSGKDYLASLNKKPEAERLASKLSGNGLSSVDADKLTASRAKNDLFDTTGNQLGKDDFLMLLTTQLKYQDPLEPVSNEDYIAQLAQFTSLENSTNMTKSLEDMNENFHKSLTVQQESAKALQLATESIDTNIKNQSVAQLATNNAVMAGIVGKDVRVNVNKVVMQYENGAMPEKRLFFKTDIPAEDVEITIKNSKGETVRNLRSSTLSAASNDAFEPYGAFSKKWDGLDNKGNQLPPDTYSLSISAKSSGKSVGANIFEQGAVGGVDYSADGMMVQIKCKDWDRSTAAKEIFNNTTVPVGLIASVLEHTETKN
ncbi:MAG: hypothetical protein JNL74_13560 [Fibrobacteres bacterium]|nr:hypothetical protein [Fibrobacterota bacterium]